MKMTKSLIVVLLLFSVKLQSQNIEEFKDLLNNCNMNIDILNGYIEKSIVDNDDMKYDYSIGVHNVEFELRYAIRPIQLNIYKSEAIRKKMSEEMNFRNSSYLMVLKTIILNITDGVEFPIQEMDKNSVRDEFNADWGAASVVILNSKFGKGFNICQIFAIHKKDIADAYYFYLSNDATTILEYMDPVFHSLKFN